MLHFLKKDLLLMLRDRSELMLLLLMPLLLIAILGFALGGLLGGGAGNPIHLQAALVLEDDVAAAPTGPACCWPRNSSTPWKSSAASCSTRACRTC